MSLTTEVSVSIEQQYAVTVGTNLWSEVGSFCKKHYTPEKLVIIIDEYVNSLHGERVHKECSELFNELEIIEIPRGETSKSISCWNKTLDAVLKSGIERKTPLLAVGGGVTGDIAGFVAATALRGIPLIHMPTSLLAMVDSSIGGKTGINHETGKNLIGSFYQPDAVFADVDYLETLSEKEWVNGLSEILKYAAISDPSLFELAYDCVSSGFQPGALWTKIIGQSAVIKSEIVSHDTLEAGERAFLNFGHTFGHALEKKAGYGTISHGEAVLVGMLAACKASNELGAEVPPEIFDDFLDLYSIQLEELTIPIDKVIEAMQHDKKVQNGNIRLVLLKDWGRPYLHTCTDERLLREAWNFAYRTINEN
ncbi:3-dehydroquinate synthase [Balneolaceae bacterium YR4-1]|uniref:3-dehydroquinate synthase n=1 Tax=Halalkalibaculum roseum TaxID=2709311 RepID=A0A6M1T058_9BACT|nr:3-dehydroquinate synthase [Halalkalibaculum roseum]NGP76874.1 3-dehydroquinate synthase [Halalkalibaculum roseum]